MATLGRLDSMTLSSNLDYIKDQVDKINRVIVSKDEKIDKIVGSLDLIKTQLEIQNKLLSKIDDKFVGIIDYTTQEVING